MKKEIFTYLILIILVLQACNPDPSFEIRGYTEKIIVEGYIESGQYPRVYVSRNIPLSVDPDSVNYINYIIRVAKVTISDGTQTEVLMSDWDRTKFPPFSYRGTSLKGVAGKTYTLKVEVGGYTVEGRTTIPEATGIQQISVVAAPEAGLKQLMLTMNLTSGKKTAFRIFTLKKKNKQYTESPFLYNSDFNLQGVQTWPVFASPEKNDPAFSEGNFFASGDTIMIRVSEIDSTSTVFFRGMSLMSGNGIGKNYFTGEKEALKSNITSPGFGIWWGGAVGYYQYIVP